MKTRSFKFTEDECKQLKELSERDGITQTDIIKKALKLYCDSTETLPKNDAQNSELVEILTSQIEIKDAQIKTLSEQLSDVQENLKNEQILHLQTQNQLESPEVMSWRERRRWKKEQKRRAEQNL